MKTVATLFVAQRQQESARRAETRQKGIIAQEQARQKKQEGIVAAQEAETAKQIGGRLRATAGKRAGRRSLLFGAETGVQSQLGLKQQLG